MHLFSGAYANNNNNNNSCRSSAVAASACGLRRSKVASWTLGCLCFPLRQKTRIHQSKPYQLYRPVHGYVLCDQMPGFRVHGNSKINKETSLRPSNSIFSRIISDNARLCYYTYPMFEGVTLPYIRLRSKHERLSTRLLTGRISYTLVLLLHSFGSAWGSNKRCLMIHYFVRSHVSSDANFKRSRSLQEARMLVKF